MHEVAEALSAWNTFYVMTGSSAGALTGLVFIVITIIRDHARDQSPGTAQAGLATFTTPTIVHFGAALFVSAFMSAPFRSFQPVAAVLGLTGSLGVLYVVRIAQQAAQMPTYEPDREDWTWNVALPFLAYLLLIAGAIGLHTAPATALFAPASAALLLLFVGIHNAWDVVTFLTVRNVDSADAEGDSARRT